MNQFESLFINTTDAVWLQAHTFVGVSLRTLFAIDFLTQCLTSLFAHNHSCSCRELDEFPTWFHPACGATSSSWTMWIVRRAASPVPPSWIRCDEKFFDKMVKVVRRFESNVFNFWRKLVKNKTSGNRFVFLKTQKPLARHYTSRL